MFKKVSPQPNFPKLEEEVLKYWQKNKVFEKSLKKREQAKKFTFYDGPPFATGLPHYGHILAMAIKDAVTRYKTMRGFYVPRRLGWDCHGLPVEYEVEKELNISSKKQIEEMGIDKFCQACRGIVFRYTKEWEKTIDRMGRWADKENTYATLDLDYMESIWWVFKQIWDKDLIYQGFKSMPYCPRCGTPLSNFETNQGYKDNVEDPSVYVKFRLKPTSRNNILKNMEQVKRHEIDGNAPAYMLSWTTTPWTLPGNVALAVKPGREYGIYYNLGHKEYLVGSLDGEWIEAGFEKAGNIRGEKLIGLEYLPFYQFLPLSTIHNHHLIVGADFISTDEGTGIVHIAPAFGEIDLEIATKENLQIIQTVNERGEFIKEVSPWAGLFVKNADKKIIEDLKNRNLLYREETILHTYPFCWRCETPLIYYAISSWFVKVSDLRGKLVKNNKKIHWMPEHIKEGRFGKWLEEARDWAISRNRYWGAPIPIWQCPKCKKNICIGSLKELNEKKVGDKKINDVHRPYIDEIRVRCDCGGEAQRIPEVLDCWFESGAMPYAQDHYPFDNKENFEKNFPADFIAEGLDMTRGWFYTLHVLATILFNEPAFKNCIVNGIVLDTQGKKLSKRLRNYPEPTEIFEKYGADSLRFLLLSSPASLAEELRISDEIIGEVSRKVFLILWNVYNFFLTYAGLDYWKPNSPVKSKNILDKWIVSKLNQLILEVTKTADDYNLPKTLNPIADFIHNDLSTWYVRRIRDRVGPTAPDGEDKNAAHQTLYEVLVTLAKLLAPFTPFIADEIYRNLNGEESVHLTDWPKTDDSCVDVSIQHNMDLVRKVCELGHAQRKKYKIKVRQPLSRISIKYQVSSIKDEYLDLIKDELNVKNVEFMSGSGDLAIEFDTQLTSQLLAEGRARELVRQIQDLRKEAGLKLDEKIIVFASSWPKEFEDYIKHETLALKIEQAESLSIKRTTNV